MRPTFVIYGNCQGAILQQAMKFIPMIANSYEVVYYQSFKHPVDGVAVIDPDIMARCSLLWRQIDDNAPFSFEGPRAADCREIVFPAVDLGVLWPFQGNDPLFPSEPAYPYGMFPYGDRLLIEVASAGLDGSAGLDRFSALWQDRAFPFDRYLDVELQRLVKREQGAHVRIAAWVLSHYRTDRLLWSYNHPTKKLFAELLNRLINATFPEARSEGHPLVRIGNTVFHDWDPFADEFQVPVYPQVAEALSLQWWQPGDCYAFHNGEMLVWKDFVQRYLSERIARQ